MTTEQSTNVYDAPTSLEEEARAHGIEIQETTTDQLEFEGNEDGDPLQNDEGGNESDNNIEEPNDESTDDDSDGDDSDEGQADENLQEEVDKHTKAVESLKKDLKDKGVDFNAAVKEYERTGDLSEETIKALEDAGYPVEVLRRISKIRV